MSSDDIVKVLGFGTLFLILAVVTLSGFFRLIRRWDGRNEVDRQDRKNRGRIKKKKQRSRNADTAITSSSLEHQPHYPGVTTRPLVERLVHARSDSDKSTSRQAVMTASVDSRAASKPVIPESLGLVNKPHLGESSQDFDASPNVASYRVDIRLNSGEVFEGVTLLSLDEAPAEVVVAMSTELQQESLIFLSREQKIFVIHSSHVRWIVSSRTAVNIADAPHRVEHGASKIEKTRGTVG